MEPSPIFITDIPFPGREKSTKQAEDMEAVFHKTQKISVDGKSCRESFRIIPKKKKSVHVPVRRIKGIIRYLSSIVVVFRIIGKPMPN